MIYEYDNHSSCKLCLRESFVCPNIPVPDECGYIVQLLQNTLNYQNHSHTLIKYFHATGPHTYLQTSTSNRGCKNCMNYLFATVY